MLGQARYEAGGDTRWPSASPSPSRAGRGGRDFLCPRQVGPGARVGVAAMASGFAALGGGGGRVGGRGQRSGPSEADRSPCLLFLCRPEARPVLPGDRPGLRVSLLPSPTHCMFRAEGGRPPSYQLRLIVTEPRTNQSSPGHRSSQRPPWSGPGHTSASGHLPSPSPHWTQQVLEEGAEREATSPSCQPRSCPEPPDSE